MGKGFWNRAVYSETNFYNGTPCLEWTGCKNNKGYGKVSYGGNKDEHTHRVAWMILKGDIPRGVYILHHCDNPLCMNVEHLFLGTRQDNIDDMVKKGRQARAGNNGFSKLKEQDILDIRDLFSKGYRNADLAKTFGVSHTAISYILSGKTWSWLE